MSDKETALRDAAILFIKRHNAVCAASDDIPEGAWQLFVKFAAECTAPAPQPAAELIAIWMEGKGRREEFALLPGYQPPEGVTVLSRIPLFTREALKSCEFDFHEMTRETPAGPGRGEGS